MKDINFEICFFLETRYKKIFDLPSNWDNIDFHNKCELLGKALNNETKIENLEEYKEFM